MTVRLLRSTFAAACLALAAVLIAPRAAAAQDPAPDSVRVVRPTGEPFARPPQPDTLPPRISPRGAFLRSLIFPGWGQSELGATGRGGVYFTLEAGSLWMWYKTNQKLGEARDEQALLRETGQIAPDRRTALVRARENQREDWITLSIFWLFFSGADAFVAAHLQDFDVHVNAIPVPGGAMQIQATVPVGP